MTRDESEDWYTGDEKRKKIKDMRAKSTEPRYSHPQGKEYSSNPKNAAFEEALDRVIGIDKVAETNENLQKLDLNSAKNVFDNGYFIYIKTDENPEFNDNRNLFTLSNFAVDASMNIYMGGKTPKEYGFDNIIEWLQEKGYNNLSFYTIYSKEPIAIEQKMASYRIAADEDITKLPVQYKPVKKAPGKDMGYQEPDVIDSAKGDAEEAIKMFKAAQVEIDTLQKQIKTVSAPLQEALLNAVKPFTDQVNNKTALLSSYLNMVYDELAKTKDKVSTYSDQIYTALNREVAKAPPASLAQIIQKAKELDPKIADEINRIKSLIENENTKMVLEQYLYEYPISEVQKKKISTVMGFDSLIDEITSIVRELKELNSSI
jgi:hypothetical protein